MNKINISPEEEYNRFIRLDYLLLGGIGLLALFRVGYAYFTIGVRTYFDEFIILEFAWFFLSRFVTMFNRHLLFPRKETLQKFNRPGEYERFCKRTIKIRRVLIFVIIIINIYLLVGLFQIDHWLSNLIKEKLNVFIDYSMPFFRWLATGIVAIVLYLLDKVGGKIIGDYGVEKLKPLINKYLPTNKDNSKTG